MLLKILTCFAVAKHTTGGKLCGSHQQSRTPLMNHTQVSLSKCSQVDKQEKSSLISEVETNWVILSEICTLIGKVRLPPELPEVAAPYSQWSYLFFSI